jgi:hypothetical protein
MEFGPSAITQKIFLAQSYKLTTDYSKDSNDRLTADFIFLLLISKSTRIDIITWRTTITG